MPESGLTVVLVEDDPAVRLGCEQALELEGYATLAFDNAEAARAALCADFPGIVVSDVRLPGMDGLALLKSLQALDSQLPVVLITGHGDINMAVQAMKDGAYHFLEKPFSPEQLVDVVQRTLEKRALTLEVKALRQRLAGQDDIAHRLIGRSPAMVELRRLITDLADTDADVLIHGETGSGKELVARCLHDLSRRRKGQFVALNCGGLPESVFESELFGHEAGAFTGAQKQRVGKIEYASGGTLFLDEIETMPMLLQIKLLRVFQERVVERLGSNRPIPVDCRLLAATKASPAVQAFGIVLVLLVWINYTSQVILYAAAWARTHPAARAVRDRQTELAHAVEGPSVRLDPSLHEPDEGGSRTRVAFAAGGASMLALMALVRRVVNRKD